MPRTRDIERQKRDLTAATWRALARRGLSGLTVAAVAEDAGCTTGLVFHTFPTKRDLLAHARRTLTDRAIARLEAIEASAPDPMSALNSVVRALLTASRGASDEARVWVSFLAAALTDPSIAEHHLRGNRMLLARIERLTAAARPDWSAEKVTGFAVDVSALSEGLNALSLLDDQEYSVDRQDAAIARLLDRLD
ncbi:TetR family transcriptional regulator [Microbacterium bovistercoris]|uniref:TetR family transcriptional regulator n=1 Tax=Microbacterium bovistercoris TaxID=2293570 RepID=A0A371NPQ3_9MICO|nr:TetR family transcriptional regulator C-terminal domain-containing protein [Microbacterium bovistercoris]REJ04138.1 TetR family transcriptional regulator [Microbacterium bovistercoris]